MLKCIGIRWFCLGLIVLAHLSGSALSGTTSRDLTDSSDDITLPLLPSTTSSQVALPTTTLGRSTASINIGIEKTLVRRRSKKSMSSTSSSLRSTSKSSSSSSKSISTSKTPSLSPSKVTVLSTTSTSLKTSTSNASSKTQTSSTVKTSSTSHPSSLSSSTSKGSQSTISSSPIKTVTGSSSPSLSRSSSSTFTSTSRLSITTTNPSPSLTSSSHSKTTSTLSSSQTYSFTTASATSCPDFYGFSSWNLLSLNTSDTGYRYGLYGLRDANGFLQYVGYFAVWTVSDVESDPDIVFDVSTPGIVRTIYPNGTNVLMDSTQGIVTISDCTDQFTFQLSGSTNPSKRSRSTSNQTSASELDHRAKLGLLPITITSKNECGSFDPVPPNIHCFDSTPGIPFPDHGAYVWNGVSVSPGTFTATCSFTPPNYNLATSFSCTQAYPAIDSICTTSNKFNPDGSPYSFSTLCVNVAEQTQSKILMTLCVLADPVNFLCQAIKAYTGGMGTDSLREGLCGVTAQHTYITVSISDSSNPNSAETVIAQVSSDNPTPITYQYQRKPSISNFKCTPCLVNPSGAGTSQLFIGPWETIYSGGLSLSFGCQGTSQSYLWSAPVSAGSISDAAAQCQAIAENLSGASFSAEFDTMTWTDPSYTSTPASCAVFQCAMAADAFKIDLTYQDSSTFTIVPEAIGVK